MPRIFTKALTSGVRHFRPLLFSASIVALLPCLLFPTALQAQKDKDPLTDNEADQIRELRDQPVQRIKLYQKFIEDRLAAIKQIGPNPKADDRKVALRAKMEEFTRLADELQDNLDTFDDAHADIRKALKDLAPASAKWPEILKQAAPDPAYDFSQETALNAAQSTADQTKQMLEHQQKYFAEHKDEANKNGMGPS